MFRLAAHIIADFFSICAVQRLPSTIISAYVQCNGYPPWNGVPNKERRPREKRRPDHSKITDTEYGRRSQD